MRRQPISHRQGWFVAQRSGDESVGFELAEVLPQHLNGHSGHGSAKLAKSKGAFAEAAEDHGFPAASITRIAVYTGHWPRSIWLVPGWFMLRTPNEQGTSKCLVVKAIERTYTVVELWQPPAYSE
jgi:hypothetical protein